MKKLHQLIQSLSKSEKRIIKMRLNSSKSASIINKHFDTLCQQKEYDFEPLLKEGANTVKLTQSNLSLLYEVVLKHLRPNHSNKDIEYSLRDLLLDIKTLMNKGFYDEAKSRCLRLIEKAESREAFEVLKSTYEELWDITLLKGELKEETTVHIQLQLNNCREQLNEIFLLESIYREATTLYYQFFFQKRDSSFKDKIKELCKKVNQDDLKSDKAKHIAFEIKAIESVIIGDSDIHHEIRKNQLIHIISSLAFQNEHLHKLLVLSNVFIKLKSKRLIKELDAFLDFMEDYFHPIIKKESDSVLSEKFYDIYFANQAFLQVWLPNKDKITALSKLFQEVIAKKLISNPVLIGRIYLSIIELNILSENYKSSIPFLVEFFNFSKKNKYSINYIEGELQFLIAEYLMGNMDVFDNSLEQLNKKIRRHDIELNQDLKVILELVNDISKDNLKDADYYLNQIPHRQTFKLYILKIVTKKTLNVIRDQYFLVNDLNYNPSEDPYLNLVKQLTQ